MSGIRHNSAFRHYLVARFVRMASLAGFHLNEGARVLDFGCGRGEEVYRWREDGFDACGFDLHDTPALRCPEDARFFSTLGSRAAADRSDGRVAADDYRIGFEDGSFDFAFSITVLEHVQDYDLAFRELGRVMKPASLGIHVFPGSYTLVEPHMNVPLASRFHAPWWFRLWARLGVRNGFQQGMPAERVAADNLRYARTGINYLRPQEVLTHAGRYFNEVYFAPHYWEYPSPRANRLFASERRRHWYTLTRDAVLVTARY